MHSFIPSDRSAHLLRLHSLLLCAELSVLWYSRRLDRERSHFSHVMLPHMGRCDRHAPDDGLQTGADRRSLTNENAFGAARNAVHNEIACYERPCC